MATTHDEVLLKNFRALRGRAGLDHARLAARMHSLGYAWTRQTVSKIERKVRTIRTDELLGLAACLETSVTRLLSPLMEDNGIELPSGLSLRVVAVEGYVTGEWITDERILWLDDKPILNPRPGQIRDSEG